MTQAVTSLKVHGDDNVAIVLTMGGLSAGAEVDAGVVLRDDVPFGHKVALVDLAKGDAVIRYGVTIGIALEDLPKGSWVNEHLIALPEAPSLESLKAPDAAPASLPPLEGL